MNRKLARSFVEFLRPAGPSSHSVAELKSLTPPKWDEALPWLHRSGLALYFCRQAQESGNESVLPPALRERLQNNLRDNARRTLSMAEEFDNLNRRFESAGVHYAAIKGFALVPDYCSDAALRSQFDLDYLIHPASMEDAKIVLHEQGYVRKALAGEVHPYVYVHADRLPRRPAGWDGLYSPQLYASIELHLRLWEAEREKVALEVPRDLLAQVCVREWQGLWFLALNDQDTVAYQAVHTLRHILNCWCRLSLFLEIAHFLQARSEDVTFWGELRERIKGCCGFAEALGLTFSLASGLFQVDTPTAARPFSTETLSPAMRVWISRYGFDSALENYSGNKFSLFLHRELIRSPEDWKEIRRRRLFPIQKPNGVAAASKAGAASHLAAMWKSWVHAQRRLRFHLGAAARYAWEYPKWQQARRDHGRFQSLPTSEAYWKRA